ncbi:hypothetical protein Gotur_034069, partial [Gossypium turneri]
RHQKSVLGLVHLLLIHLVSWSHHLALVFKTHTLGIFLTRILHQNVYERLGKLI